ncbi:hypothetical protein V6N11_034114 [Hibiscus sabdariffa]|uniref:Uncharacterized protein n=1 Tax=Hibiscus sabdariffa TaxID=183260 RepID=A0ABR2S1F3_9ROSI
MVKVATYFAMAFGAFVFWQTMDKVHVWIALHQDEKKERLEREAEIRKMRQELLQQASENDRLPFGLNDLVEEQCRIVIMHYLWIEMYTSFADIGDVHHLPSLSSISSSILRSMDKDKRKLIMVVLSLALVFSLAKSFDNHESDLASKESLWDLYERWRSHHTVSHGLEEKKK